MAEGSFVHRVADLELEPAPLDPETILEGSPEVSELVLATSPDGHVVRGVWQITPGVVRRAKPSQRAALNFNASTRFWSAANCCTICSSRVRVSSS